MARKPARLERAGALTPRDRMWKAIRALQITETCSWSPIEVQFLANLRATEPAHIDSVESYLRGLAKAQPPYVQLLDGGRCRAELWLYRLVRDVGVEAPRVTADGKSVTEGVASEQMWTAMKALHDFDSEELAAAASTPACTVSVETVKSYLKYLERAGYVTIVQECQRGRGGSKARYRFNRAKNTGPRAPLITKLKEVMDGNTAEIVWTPNKGEKGCRNKT